MSTLTVREMLKQEIDSLPEPLTEEVFDFVLFVKAQHAEEAFLWQQVEETRAYRQQHPQEVMTVTSAEWEDVSSYLENEH
jgi:hypothetical protein